MANNRTNTIDYISPIIEKLKENYVSAIVGLIIFLLAISYISNYFGQTDKVNLGGLLGKNDTVEKTAKNKTKNNKVYIVKAGDTLWSISEQKIGSGYNFVDIAKANNIANPNLIEKGQKLTIPDVKPIKPITGSVTKTKTGRITITGNSYTVVRGDNLWNIAVAAYGDGYQWPNIARLNNLSNPNLIHKGNVLRLPR